MGADFEVYVHVPFCLRRCGYCDFNTYTAPDLGAGQHEGRGFPLLPVSFPPFVLRLAPTHLG